VGIIALAVGLAITLAALMPWVLRFWRAIFEIGAAALQLPGEVVTRAWQVGPVSMDVPIVTAQAGPPDGSDWVLVGIISGLVLAASFTLPIRFLPLAMLFRFGVVAQVSAFIVFWLAPSLFDYALQSYTQGFLKSGAGFLVLVPLALGLIYFPFDVGLRSKVGLTVILAGHLTVLIPLHVLGHIYLMHHLSLLVLPTLVFIFGIVLEVLAFVALYGWGMSWQMGTTEPRGGEA
jgi:hypothetical protein